MCESEDAQFMRIYSANAEAKRSSQQWSSDLQPSPYTDRSMLADEVCLALFFAKPIVSTTSI